MNKIAQKLALRRFRAMQKATVRKWHADNGDSKLRLEYPLDSESTVFDLGGDEGQ